MNTLPIALEAVDRAEVTILMDNFVDVLLASSADVRRYVQLDISDRNQLIAEHGFSALVTVESDGRRSSVLYDAGLTPQGLTRNLDVLQVPVRDLRAIVISHGHGPGKSSGSRISSAGFRSTTRTTAVGCQTR